MFDQPKLKIMQVCWVDANIKGSLMQSDLKNLLGKNSQLLAPYWAVGYKVGETEEVLMLADAVLPKMDDESEDEYRRVLMIPKVQIKEIWELKTEKKKGLNASRTE